MAHRTILLIFLLKVLPIKFTDATSYGDLNFTSLAALAGYSAQAHAVTTPDGYILTVFRLTGPACTTNSTPVLLMHGLLMNSDSWLDAGNASLAYLLADDCQDLWVGNVRGNSYGRRHVRLDPDQNATFWDFSLNEVGFYDIPALIDYVRDATGRDKINYIGYSQGAGTCLIACSERPEYNDRINILFAIAPATKLTNIKSPIVVNFGAAIEMYLKSLPHVGHGQEAFEKGSVLQTDLEEVCDYADRSSEAYEFCLAVLLAIDSNHPGSVTAQTEARLFAHLPNGASARMLLHYLQLTRAEDFDKYDYGSSQNLAFYGTPVVPRFNMTLVTAPVAILYGPKDYLVIPDDVKWLNDQLPNVVRYTPINDTEWNHLDVCYSKDIPTKIYAVLKEYL